MVGLEAAAAVLPLDAGLGIVQLRIQLPQLRPNPNDLCVCVTNKGTTAAKRDDKSNLWRVLRQKKTKKGRTEKGARGRGQEDF